LECGLGIFFQKTYLLLTYGFILSQISPLEFYFSKFRNNESATPESTGQGRPAVGEKDPVRANDSG
jgi:hypothetical protein